MKKVFFRVASMALALIMAFTSLVACNKDTDETNTNTQDTVDSATDYKGYPLLEKKDFGGKVFTVALGSGSSHEFMSEKVAVSESVSAEVFQRNSTVSERYNCDFEFISVPAACNKDTYTSTIYNNIMAGSEGAFDFISTPIYFADDLILNDSFANIRESDVIEFDAPWWSGDANEKFCVNGKQYVLVGDIAYTFFATLGCMFYNKQMAAQYGINGLYDTVRNGDWTHEKLSEYVKDVYGDSGSIKDKKDVTDKYGLVSPGDTLRTFIASYNMTRVDENLEINWVTEHNIDVVETLVDFYLEDGCYTEESWFYASSFAAGRAIFTTANLAHASNFGEMKDDYGVLPVPKFDKSQMDYYTRADDTISVIGITTNVANKDDSAFIIEALCRESTDTTIDEYYNVVMQYRYSNESDDKDMITLIYGSAVWDFSDLHKFVPFTWNVQDFIQKSNKDFASSYEREEGTYLENLADALSHYGLSE